MRLPDNAESCGDDPPSAVNKSAAEVAIIFRDGNYVREISGGSHFSAKDALVIVQSCWQSFTIKK